MNLCLVISAQTLSLNTADTDPFSRTDNTGFYDTLLKEVMNNIGIELEINHYPSERSILWANQGHDDGEFARIDGIAEKYPNLIVVEEPLIDFHFVALKKYGRSFNPSSWEDLKNIRVGYLNGWKIFEDNLPEETETSEAQNVESLFNLLLADRVDVILYSKIRAESYMTASRIENIEIIDPPLAIRAMHLYLHKRNAALILGINNELIRIKGSGRYNELLKTALNSQ